MFLLHVALLVLLRSSLSFQQESRQIDLIKDYNLKLHSLPVSIHFFSCWPKYENLKLMQELSRNLISIKIYRESNEIIEKPSYNALFVLDSNCHSFQSILQKAEKHGLFHEPYKWLVLNYDGLDHNLENLNILIDSDFVVQGEYGRLISLYKYAENNTRFVRQNLGYLDNENNGLKLKSSSNRMNLFGTEIAISFLLTKPESVEHLFDYREAETDGLSKLSFLLVNDVLDILNATRKSIIQKSWGYKNATTGLFDGMFGDLQASRAVIGATPGFMTKQRMEVVDYVPATLPYKASFVFRAPPLSYITNVFVLPFDAKVWCSCLITCTITLGTLYVIAIWEKNLQTPMKNLNDIKSVPADFQAVVMVEFGAVSQQGSDVEPKSLSGRIAVFLTFLVLMFIYNAYAANIVVLLQSTSNNFNSLQALLNSRISLGAEDIVFNYHYLKTADGALAKEIYNKKIAPKGQQPLYLPLAEGIEKVRKEFFALHCITSSAYKIVLDTFQEHEKCGLVEVDFIKFTEPTLSVKKGSPYKEIMKIGFRKLYESGVRHRGMKRLRFDKPSCSARDSSFISVGLRDSYFAFELFCSGLAASLVLLAAEMAISKKNRFFW